MAVALAACGNDSDNNTSTPTPVTPSVTIGGNQAFELTPGSDGMVAAADIGRLSFVRSSSDLQVFLTLTGTGSDSFSINSSGQIRLTAALDSARLPLTLTAQARLSAGAAPAATATVSLYALGAGGGPGTGTGSEPRVSFVAGQSFMVTSNNPAGEVFGQVSFASEGISGNPVFRLSGADASSFAIDASARLSPTATATLTAGATLNVTVEAHAGFASTTALATTAVTVMVIASEPVLTVSPPEDVELELPVGAGDPVATVSATLSGATGTLSYSIIAGNALGLFAIGADGSITVTRDLPLITDGHILRILVADTGDLGLSSTIDLTVDIVEPEQLAFTQEIYLAGAGQSGFSETSQTGQCLIGFEPPPEDGSASGCAVDVYVIGDDGSGEASYGVSNLNAANYALSESQLILTQAPDYPASGEVSFSVTATVTGLATPATATVVLQMIPPMIAFREQSYSFTDLPLDVENGDALDAQVRADVQAGADRHPISYAISDGDDAGRFAIDSASGEISYSSDVQPTVAESFTLTVTASRSNAETAEAEVNLVFAPAIAIAEESYSGSVDSDTNYPGAFLPRIVATTTPATTADGQPLPIGYRVTGNDAEYFRVDENGFLRLQRALTEDAEATVEAFIGNAMDSANVSVTVMDLDFRAYPVASPDSDGLLVQFSAVVPSDVSATSFSWDFGDGGDGAEGPDVFYQYASENASQSEAGFNVTLTVTLADSSTQTIESRVFPFLSLDPLTPLQWHLRHPKDFPYFFGDERGAFGPEPFRDILGRPAGKVGEDIRAPDPNLVCGVLGTCRGEGVIVRVMDSGAQLTHPDLLDNASPSMSWDVTRGESGRGEDPYVDPGISIGDLGFSGEGLMQTVNANNTAHGTAVAGIILARDNNGLGGRGIAPRSTLTSFNPIGSNTDDSYLLSFQYPTDTEGETDPLKAAHVLNMSIGADSTQSAYLLETTANVEGLIEVTTEANQGRGIFAFKAAGNDGDVFNIFRGGAEQGFGNRHASALEDLQNIASVMTISSMYPNGYEEASSDSGDNIVVAAYGAPLECLNSVQKELTSPTNNSLGIVTADPVGSRGYEWRIPKPLVTFFSNGETEVFEYPPDITDYSMCFNGTSAATPQVAGVAALMVQANPRLTWRDVRAILIETARKNSLDHTDNLGNPGWITNGAGYLFNPAFGFGAVNGADAVALSRVWQPLPEQQEYNFETPETGFQGPIADCNVESCDPSNPGSVGTPTGFSHTVSLPAGTTIDVIESVNVLVDMTFQLPDGSDATSTRGTVEISLEHLDDNGELLSRSLLHKLHPYYQTAQFHFDGADDFPAVARIDRWNYLTLRHFGESPGGTWRLVIDDHAPDGAMINLEGWGLIIGGYALGN